VDVSLVLVDNSCSRVSLCIVIWLVSVPSKYLWFIHIVLIRCSIKLLISCMLSCSPWISLS
jgi:hypothetical protein